MSNGFIYVVDAHVIDKIEENKYPGTKCLCFSPWPWSVIRMGYFFYSRDPSFMSLIDSPLFVKFSKMANFNFRESWFAFFFIFWDSWPERGIYKKKAYKTMVLINARASAIIALLEEDKNVTSGIRILNLKAIWIIIICILLIKGKLFQMMLSNRSLELSLRPWITLPTLNTSWSYLCNYE